jgi:hypothetical protein
MNVNDWNQERAREIYNEIADGAKNESGEWQEAGASIKKKPTVRKRERKKRAGLVEKYKKVNLKVQRICFFLAMLAIGTLPLVANIYYRVTVVTFAVGLALRMLVTIEDENKRQSRETKDALVALSQRLKPSAVARFKDFTHCQPFISADCEMILNTGRDLVIDSLVIAAKYSWHQYFREKLRELADANQQQTITYNLALVSPEHLAERGASYWAKRSESTAKEVREFMANNHCPNLIINLLTYDRLPDDHGIILDSRILYRGQTQSEYRKGAPPELMVGSRPYRRFCSDDPNEVGEVRRFASWMHWARLRDAELTAVRPHIVEALFANPPKLSRAE